MRPVSHTFSPLLLKISNATSRLCMKHKRSVPCAYYMDCDFGRLPYIRIKASGLMTRVNYLASQAPSALFLHCAVRTQAVGMLPDVQIELGTNLRRSISKRTQNTVTVQSYQRTDHFACDRGHGACTTLYCCIGRFHACKSQLTQTCCGGQTITRGPYVMY